MLYNFLNPIRQIFYNDLNNAYDSENTSSNDYDNGKKSIAIISWFI